jgi:hypothetical protein
MPPLSKWLLRTQQRWANLLPDNLASAQAENALQRMILRGVAQGARISDIACSLGLSRAQACQLHKAALLAKAVPVLIYFKEREAPHRKTGEERGVKPSNIGG